MDWPWGEGGLQERAARSSWLLGAAVLCPALCRWETEREEEEEEREKKKKMKESKRGKQEKNMKKFSNLKIFREENKRQFMKLVKKLFLYKKGINLIIIK
jgi:hypothetical protein